MSPKIIFAYDRPIRSMEEIRRIRDNTWGVKIGPVALMNLDSSELAPYLFAQNVMLDMKFHDIPETVGAAVSGAIKKFNPHILTVHAAGGVAMMSAAVDEAKRYSHFCKIFAVTVLTSRMERMTRWEVLEMAEQALRSNCHGITCPALFAPTIRQEFRESLEILVPGVGAQGLSFEDAEACGADYLVIGRSIINYLEWKDENK